MDIIFLLFALICIVLIRFMLCTRYLRLREKRMQVTVNLPRVHVHYEGLMNRHNRIQHASHCC